MDSTPPPLPPVDAPCTEQILAQPVLIGGQLLPGTEGMTLGDVELDVLKGGRFLSFTWNISVILLSYRKNTGLIYVPSHRKSGHHALGWGVFSLLFGWWGFPWGLIYTPASLWKNASGGNDHTRDILTVLLGADHANEIMQQAVPRKADGLLWTLRVLIFLVLGLICYGFYCLFQNV